MDKNDGVNLWKYRITDVPISKILNSYNSRSPQNTIYSFQYTTVLGQVGK